MIQILPGEYSQETLGAGCPLAEQGSKSEAPADTDVFCARQTHDGDSARYNCTLCCVIHYFFYLLDMLNSRDVYSNFIYL